jgi:uncharacterized lipoprotein YbaY
MLPLLFCLSVPAAPAPQVVVDATDLPAAALADLHGRRVRYTADVVSSVSWDGLVSLDHPDDKLEVTAVVEAEVRATVTVEGTLLFIRHPPSVIGTSTFPAFTEVWIVRVRLIRTPE